MRDRRIVWSLLALLTGVLGVVAIYLAYWPLLQFTSCEIDPSYNRARCAESIVDREGSGVVLALIFPAVLCIAPAVVPYRNIEYGVAVLLAVGAAVAFGTVGGAAILLVVTSVAALAISFRRPRHQDGAATPAR